MTADIVNLRQARKRRDKAARQAEADANRIKFGRTKHERDLARLTDAQSAKRLDGHLLEGTPGRTDGDEGDDVRRIEEGRPKGHDGGEN